MNIIRLSAAWLVPLALGLASVAAAQDRLANPRLPYSGPVSPQRPMANPVPVAPADRAATAFYEAGTDDDVRVKTAKALAAERRYLSAATELHSATLQRPIESLPESLQWQMGDTFMAFSLQDAKRYYRLAGAGSTDRERYARAQMMIADQDYRRARYPSALRTLNALRDDLPPSQVNAWKYQLTRVLLAAGQYGDAIEMLEELDKQRDGDIDNFVRYNLGLAQINDGRALEGRDTLDKVGRMTARTEIDYALRDRANLVLGWHFLQNQQGGTAKAILQRVRAQGAASSRALLGLGWAELLPRGERQVRASPIEDEVDPFNSMMSLGGMLRPGFIENDVFRRSGFAIYSRAKMAPDEEAALQRALAAWMELMGRDPMDPAVQEAALAIPYTLDRIGAHTQALEYYEKAIEVLELNRERQRQALISIEGGVMLNTLVRRDADDESSRDWELRDLPDVPETYYLQTLLASHRFQEGLKNYRDLRLLNRTIDSWKGRLDAVITQYQNVTRDPVDPSLLFAAAVLDRPAPRADIKLKLKSDPTMAPPGSYQRPHDPLPPHSVKLPFSAMPAHFTGTYENALRLRAEANVLSGQLELAVAEHLAVLNDIARAALAEQQLTIIKYLAEARFALARLYDRERQESNAAPGTEAR